MTQYAFILNDDLTPQELENITLEIQKKYGIMICCVSHTIYAYNIMT